MTMSKERTLSIDYSLMKRAGLIIYMNISETLLHLYTLVSKKLQAKREQMFLKTFNTMLTIVQMWCNSAKPSKTSKDDQAKGLLLCSAY